MGILRRAGSDKPRGTAYVRRLGDQQHGAVLRVSPEGLGPVNGAFLNDAVGSVRRAGETETDEGLSTSTCEVTKEVALEVSRAAVQPELSLGVRPELKPHDRIARVHSRSRNVAIACDHDSRSGTSRGTCNAPRHSHGTDHKLRTHADQVPADTIAVHAAANEHEIPVIRTLPQLKVH